MKKPEITKGPWQFNDNGNVFHWGDGPETPNYTPCIARVSIWKNNPDKGSANARAISAVPEMMDALAGAVDELEALADNGSIIDWGLLEEMKQALKKSGVTFEGG